MATRTLEQIIGDLGSVYDPQVNSIRQHQALIPQQVQDEERGLQAKQTASFDEILGGARRRGLGFSGIPIAEQAKYNATEYMPALARLRSDARRQTLSLEDAILGINERRYQNANQIRQTEVDNDYRERTFQEQVRQYNETLAEQRRQAAAQNNSLAGLFGGGQNQPQGGAVPNKGGSLESFLRTQINNNPNAGRAIQDSWVRYWMSQNGLDPNAPNDPTGIWAAYNKILPWERYAKARNAGPLQQLSQPRGLQVLRNQGGFF